jgi:hypothetical protein
MTITTNPDEGVGRRTIHEFKMFALTFLYLYVILGVLILFKTAILHGHGVDFTPWGVAAVKAAILAKFMLIGHALKLGDSGKVGPLIWPTLYGAVTFMLLLVLLTIIEEIVVGLLHGRSVALSLGELSGSHLEETGAWIIILLLVMIPYFAFRVLAMSLGSERLMQMFFGDSARFILR